MLAQVIQTPGSPTPTVNTGGWVYGMAVLMVILGAVVTLVIVVTYMRFAPRFQRNEEARKGVRATRLQPGREAPRRPVNITGAPVVVPPPAAAAPAPLPVAVGAAAPVAAPVPAPAAAAVAPAPAVAPNPPPAAPPAPAPAAPAAPSAAPANAPAPTPAPAAGEHKEVALDQETFDRVLAELLDKGTDRRVAEGQARRAAMIAARKKAEG